MGEGKSQPGQGLAFHLWDRLDGGSGLAPTCGLFGGHALTVVAVLVGLLFVGNCPDTLAQVGLIGGQEGDAFGEGFGRGGDVLDFLLADEAAEDLAEKPARCRP